MIKTFALLALMASTHICRAQAGPSITSINPSTVLAGSPGFSMTIMGAGFTPGMVLLWGSNPALPVSLVSANQLSVSIPASLVASAASVSIAVQNAAGVRSNDVAFTIAQSPISISPATLPQGIVGVAYSQTLIASGGKPPYRWSFAGTLPVALNANTGVLAGTPDTRGVFNFAIMVVDSTGTTGIKTFALTVGMPPLVIVTDSPIFNGTVGLFYSQTFHVTGGIPPYQWSMIDGQLPSGLKFDPNTGSITGTPSVAGSFGLTLQVTDRDGGKISKSFALTVDPPRLTIVTPSALPNAMAGEGYAQQLSASGGTPPYTWSLAGSVAGLSLDSATGMLAGIPPVPGTLGLSVQIKDAAGTPASKSFTLLVTPTPLVITSGTSLPDGTIGVPYSQIVTASGGMPPYTWSANGLPSGLNLDSATGVLSGSPQAGGSPVFTVKVTDSVRASAINLLRMNIALPPAPDCVITGLPNAASPADQPFVGLAIQSPYPITLTGQLTLSFAPDAGLGDPMIQFSTGGRTIEFNIPTGSLEANFAVPRAAIQTGTVAGTITISAHLFASGIEITADPLPSRASRVNPGAPVITAATFVRNGDGFKIVTAGFSTTREITQAIFRFKSSPGSTLQQAEVTVAVESLFTNWYQDASSTRYGSQFTFAQPFSVQGDANAVIPETVTLTNRIGSTTVPVNYLAYTGL